MSAQEMSSGQPALERIALAWLHLANASVSRGATTAARVLILDPVKSPAALFPPGAKSRQRR